MGTLRVLPSRDSGVKDFRLVRHTYDGGEESDQKDKEKKEGENPDEQDQKNDQGQNNKENEEKKKKKPQPFKSKELTKDDVRKILEEIKNQEQKIRAEVYEGKGKSQPRDKDW